MRIRTLLAASHLCSAAVGGIAAACASSWEGSLTAQIGACLVAAGLAALAAWLIGSKVVQGLRKLVQTVAKGQAATHDPTGLHEFDEVTLQLREQVQRWSAVTTAARAQAREVEQMVGQIERREQRRDRPPAAAGKHLRQLLERITQTVDGELQQLLVCAHEIAGSVEEIAQGADDQSDAVSKTTTYVEQFSARVEAVAKSAETAQQAVTSVRGIAQETEAIVAQLNRGLLRVQSYLEANEQKLRSQGEHSREIGSMVQMIGSISSRTDLLALNASIESVRAGEHGRGFAVVAEEVHKLAEQAAQATREVASLIESTQVETQESIQVLTQERAEVEDEIERIGAARQAVERILSVTAESGGRVAEITSAADEQSLLTHEVALAVERITSVSKNMRSRAEKAGWTTKALSKITHQFDSALTPLRRCSNPAAPAPQSPQLASLAGELAGEFDGAGPTRQTGLPSDWPSASLSGLEVPTG